MYDPYQVLGVSRSDSDEKIKSAYRDLAKKYHPDNYDQSPLSDLAEEKMKQVNEAYDQIMNERRTGKSQNSFNGGGFRGNATNSRYPEVRDLLMRGNVHQAEQILNGVVSNSRDAEWFFLMGSVMYKKGWVHEAHMNFGRACDMDPQNLEYAAAYNEVERQRSGGFGGYNPGNPMMNRGCSPCECCQAMICADCLCDCMGSSC